MPITQGNFRLLHRLLAQIQRIANINALRLVSAIGAKVRADLVIIHTVPQLDVKEWRNSVPLRSDFERMLHLRARTFAPFTQGPNFEDGFASGWSEANQLFSHQMPPPRNR